jgi:hypothetical protein
MYELKTRVSDASVNEFVAGIADPQRRADCWQIIDLLRDVTGEEPRMWGTMIGFGEYHYKYASGHEGDMFLAGFAPRKANFTFYVYAGLEASKDLLSKLGRHRTGKGCLYVNKLSDIDLNVLRSIIERNSAALKLAYPG